MLKRCYSCSVEKDTSLFYKSKFTSDKLRTPCIECTRIRWKKRYDENRGKFIAQAASYRKKHPRNHFKCRLKEKYGMTIEHYEELMLKQSGVCAICGKKDKSRLSVDHDHATGKIRGLLCRQHNAGLGIFSDNEELLLKAIKYLKEHK